MTKRTHRVQFHPGYGYEDFVRGLQIGENGQTEYRDGVLLQIIDEMTRELGEPDLSLWSTERMIAHLARYRGVLSPFEPEPEP